MSDWTSQLPWEMKDWKWCCPIGLINSHCPKWNVGLPTRCGPWTSIITRLQLCEVILAPTLLCWVCLLRIQWHADLFIGGMIWRWMSCWTGNGGIGNKSSWVIGNNNWGHLNRKLVMETNDYTVQTGDLSFYNLMIFFSMNYHRNLTLC